MKRNWTSRRDDARHNPPSFNPSIAASLNPARPRRAPWALLAVLATATACPADDDDPPAADTGTTAMTAAEAGTVSDPDDTGNPATDGTDDRGDADATAGSTDDGTGDGDGTTGGSTGADTSTAGDSTGSGSDDSTGAEGIEIAGVWLETYPGGGMITHTIDDTMWAQDDAEFGPFTYDLVSFDNPTRTAIGDSGNGFSKLQWTWAEGDTELWYCTAVFGAKSAEAAEAGPDADDTDPANGGCGGFAWSRLMPE